MDAYLAHTRAVMGAAGWPWPERLVCDPQKAPRFVGSVA
eukprot:gene11214-5558_t